MLGRSRRRSGHNSPRNNRMLLYLLISLAAMFLNQDESTISEHEVRTLGTFCHVLLSGLVLQWLIDPGSAISAKDLTEALRASAKAIERDGSTQH